ncbi:hypothetical protein EUTSA_v10026402mg [Eutrema salsugineum]|uniref:Pectinesterase inhibitor domain-containing protein n=1 Tax=Eutrema salsugineum TaxID=72664 RepID=V4MKB1_EUTSA|nr:uncharacterized protein LOC18028435 [Eutrema salsugineum]ESQ55907.1 hypothetical protein EUTSA_v10026402mg [Eutrema salsugineum]
MTYLMMIKVLLLSLLVISNGAEDDWLESECRFTYYRGTCIRCLECHDAASVGSAQAVIHCLESQLHILNFVTSISWRKNVSATVQKVLGECIAGIKIAKPQLDEVKQSVIIRNINKAIVLVNTTLSYPLTCRENLQKLNFQESPEVYDEISVYDQLSSVARTIIKRLGAFI